jgi:hypothetical protein
VTYLLAGVVVLWVAVAAFGLDAGEDRHDFTQFKSFRERMRKGEKR